jgi:uncharacterized protein with von Willebrand factor type A (vWA) domain
LRGAGRPGLRERGRRLARQEGPISLLENVVLFGRLLRLAGLPLSPAQTRDFARALDWIDVGDRDQVFHTARSFLVTRHEDLNLFATIFELFWRAHREGTELRLPRRAQRPRSSRTEQRLDVFDLISGRAASDDPEVEVGDRAGSYSDIEALRHKDFTELTDDELEEVRRQIRDIRWQVSRRRSRRRVPHRRGGRVHLRKVLREAAKHDATPVRLWRQTRKVKQRPIVLLADISGSMDKYSRLLLHFFYAALQGLGQVECFVFGTRLTRITQYLKVRNVDIAVEQAAREILDWSGGTRIGESLGDFNRHWGRRVLRRGAVAIVVSDGWERGDAGLLRREMRHLHHRCHRLIWLNPHLGHPEYEPLVEGMATALPFIDDFLPVHNLRALDDLAAALESLPSRASGTAGVRARPAGATG